MNEKTSPPVRLVRCPSCRKSVRYDQVNPYRPFCSIRCKNEDIVGWAEESYRIAGKPTDEGDGSGGIGQEPNEHED